MQCNAAANVHTRAIAISFVRHRRRAQYILHILYDYSSIPSINFKQFYDFVCEKTGGRGLGGLGRDGYDVPRSARFDSECSPAANVEAALPVAGVDERAQKILDR